MLRWLSLIFSVFVLTLCALWFAFVRAPSPAVVCEHKIQLVMSEAKGANAGPLLDSLSATCIAGAERRIKMRGKIKYANYARCVVGASSLEQAERCSTGS